MNSDSYYSCDRLEGDLNLVFERLQFCCVTHSGGKGSVRVCDFRGGGLPFDTVFHLREELIHQNNSEGVDTPCTGCEFLVKRAWPRNDKVFRTIAIGNFTICNLRCDYCPSSQPSFKDLHLPAYAYRLEPVFTDALRTGYLTADTCILWAGGEPTILPDFEEVAQMLIEKGMKQTVLTNCVVYSPFVEEGLRRKLFNTVISVDSGTRGTFAKVKGRDLFDRVWSTISRYASTGGKVTLKYIIYHNNSNFDDIRNFIHLCKSNAILNVAVVPENTEFAMRSISEESLRAAAFLIHLAKEAGMLISPIDCFGPEYARRIAGYVDGVRAGGFRDAGVSTGCQA